MYVRAELLKVYVYS